MTNLLHDRPTVLGLIGAAILLVVLLAWLRGYFRRSYRYVAAPLLSQGEARFARALEAGLPGELRLLAKVRIADLLQPQASEGTETHRQAWIRIVGKHVDFVVADDAWIPWLAIELDDRTHEQAERRQRDQLVDAAFASAGLVLHRVRVKPDYRADVAAIRDLLRDPARLNGR